MMVEEEVGKVLPRWTSDDSTAALSLICQGRAGVRRCGERRLVKALSLAGPDTPTMKVMGDDDGLE